MTDSKPETPTLLSQARTDKFSAVTTAGNKAAAALMKADQTNPAQMAEIIKKAMPEYLQIAVSVVFEKAKIWETIEKDDNLAFYANLKYDAWCNAGDLNKSEFEKAKVIATNHLHLLIKVTLLLKFILNEYSRIFIFLNWQRAELNFFSWTVL